MEFGTNLFDAAPETWADVPVAAMRALARQQAQGATPVPTLAPSPRVRQNSAPPPADIPPPMPAALPVPKMPEATDEWGSLAKKIGKELAPKKEDPVMAKMAELERLLASARGNPPSGDKEAPDKWVAAARPRAYTPMEAPDTGEANLSDAPTGYFGKNRSFESGNNPRATNPITGAAGNYQFLPSTWRGLLKEAPHLGLTEDGIYDEKQQDSAMRYYTGKSASILKPILGRAPTGGELYASHLLGHAGGPAVIQAQDRPLTETVDPRAIAANPWLKNYATGRDLIADLNKKFG